MVPVPDSSRPQALGFSQVSGILYAEALIKNRFVERTFILPDQRRREAEVRVKLHPVPELLRGKRVVLLDDSIVRGTTLREIVRMVRDAGAVSVDVRIGCPPIIAPCYFGVDMKDRRQLVAAGRTEAEIAEMIGAQSVHYLSEPGLVESIGIPADGLCMGCLTGRYPVDVPQERRRFQKVLEEDAPLHGPRPLGGRSAVPDEWTFFVRRGIRARQHARTCRAGDRIPLRGGDPSARGEEPVHTGT